MDRACVYVGRKLNFQIHVISNVQILILYILRGERDIIGIEKRCDSYTRRRRIMPARGYKNLHLEYAFIWGKPVFVTISIFRGYISKHKKILCSRCL